MLSGNKGEWSELYVLFRLLADGKIHASDKDLIKLDRVYLPVLKIIKDETSTTHTEFIIEDSKMVHIYINGELSREIPQSIFDREAEYLINEIRQVKGKKGSFTIEKSEAFMNKINCYKLSASASNKTDITIQIFDINTGHQPTVGFSIKSELGMPPTLLNAGQTTNFIYSIESRNNYIMLEETNDIYNARNRVDVRARIKNLIKDGETLNYYDMQNSTFKNNLVLIDSVMDRIVAEALLLFYRDGISTCKDIVDKLQELNPMSYVNTYAYAYKFKKFLSSIALGMRPATEWDGTDEANGGYIIVKNNGDVIAFHLYNRNHFEEYLLNSTKFETASTSRHHFGKVYEKHNRLFINLNLQIRFT